MRKIVYLLCFVALGVMSSSAQPVGRPSFPIRPPGLGGLPPDESKLTSFDLDFPGGTPTELVLTIEKATGKPLNAIIPTEDAHTQLPPLKMNDVTVPRLFAALGAASERSVAVSSGSFGNSYSQSWVGYGFKTSDNPVTDTSIWNFYVEKPSLPPVVSTESVCRFYQLQNYLNHGFTVDDITTAIQTGWKMAGISPAPELNYHKETNLLIAFGKPADLAVIQNVLDSLPQSYMDPKQAQAVFDQVNKMHQQVNQLTEQVTFLTTNSMEKIKPAR